MQIKNLYLLIIIILLSFFLFNCGSSNSTISTVTSTDSVFTGNTQSASAVSILGDTTSEEISDTTAVAEFVNIANSIDITSAGDFLVNPAPKYFIDKTSLSPSYSSSSILTTLGNSSIGTVTLEFLHHHAPQIYLQNKVTLNNLYFKCPINNDTNIVNGTIEFSKYQTLETAPYYVADRYTISNIASPADKFL